MIVTVTDSAANFLSFTPGEGRDYAATVRDLLRTRALCFGILKISWNGRTMVPNWHEERSRK